MLEIDLEHWSRKNHFLLFRDYTNPFFSICANVDITALLQWNKKRHLPFFGSFLFFVMKTLNQIPEFRYRIRNKGVVLHEMIHPSYTVMTDQNLFRFVTTPFVDDLETFVANVSADIEKYKSDVSLVDVEGVDDLVYISSVKWVTFTSVEHAFDQKNPDSFPRITWGKFVIENGKALIPVSVCAHHALCDGLHAGLFYENLQTAINNLK